MGAKSGDQVKVHYKGTFDDGTVFDSSEGREPLAFQVGSGQVIKGFDLAVTGLEVGESRTVKIEPKDGYGEHNPEMLIKFPIEQVPADMNPQVGMPLQIQDQNGQPHNVVVHEVTAEHIVLDANHPMAGKVLNFDVTLVEVG